MIKTYDPGQVLATFAGNLISGFDETAMIKIARNAQAFTLKVGGDGEGVRSRSRNKSGQVTFTLLQSSASNDFLSAKAAEDELLGTGVGELLIKDLNGTTLAHAANAWVQKLPDSELNAEAGSRVWVLETEALTFHVGGNTVAA